MGNGLFSQLYGKRVAGRPAFGGSGHIEENDAPFSGLRNHSVSYMAGTNVTGFNRIVVAHALANGPGPVAVAINQPFTGIPMSLTVTIAGLGVRTLTVRFYGANQFFQPIIDDVLFNNAAGAVIFGTTRAAFVRVDRIEILNATGINADAMSVGATIGGNGIGMPVDFRIGLPLRISSPVAPATTVDDLVHCTVAFFSAAGALTAMADVRTTGPVVLDPVHSTMRFTVGAFVDGDGTTYLFNITVNSRLGTGDISGRAGINGYVRPA